jgi:hypothetical protein
MLYSPQIPSLSPSPFYGLQIIFLFQLEEQNKNEEKASKTIVKLLGNNFIIYDNVEIKACRPKFMNCQDDNTCDTEV